MVDPTKDHSRVSAEGRALGMQMVRFVEPVIKHLESQGEPDERCRSCAFRAGTVPNGCFQTMSDAIKAALEQKPFLCHVGRYPDGSRKMCAGWLATQWGAANRAAIQCPWDFSPADDDTAEPAHTATGAGKDGS